eukprot:1742112-Pyramimonas_sp.AAC.1
MSSGAISAARAMGPAAFRGAARRRRCLAVRPGTKTATSQRARRSCRRKRRGARRLQPTAPARETATSPCGAHPRTR